MRGRKVLNERKIIWCNKRTEVKNGDGRMLREAVKGSWKQNDTRRFKLKAGETVYIEQGALGSVLLGTEARNSTIRVKRLDYCPLT